MEKDSLVLELQRLASSNSARITDLLRKALVVATKLKIDDFRGWIESELRGYSGKVSQLPKYRRVSASLRAWNPYRGWLPVQMEDSRTMEYYAKVYLPNPVGELEDVVGKSGGRMMKQLPPEHSAVPDSGFGGVRFDTYQWISQTSIVGVLEAVRTVILEWSLRLEAEGILGEGMTFSEPEKQRARDAGGIHIGTFHGVLGDVNAESFQIGDYGTIHNQLKEKGISQESRNELEAIMDAWVKSDKTDERQSLAQKGLDWVGRNAANLGALASAIRAFFGG